LEELEKNTFFLCLSAITTVAIGGGFLCTAEEVLVFGGFDDIHGRLLCASFLE
jgi:hypothetical protein